jgi:alkaline phosphatase
MGGGRGNFLPAPAPSAAAPSAAPDPTQGTAGNRTDGRDLVREWQVAYPDGSYIVDQAGLDAVDPDRSQRVFGLFTPSHMRYEAQRLQDPAGEPSLTQMTIKAIDVLSQSRKGFFLVVEGGRIDHAHHAGNAYNALRDTIELSKAVQAAVDKVDLQNTLIIVTADHSHVFTMTGHPKRGNPILGKLVSVNSDVPALADDGLPYTTLGYANGLGFRNLGDETNADVAYAEPADAGRKDLTQVNTESPGFHQEVLVPLEWEAHGGEDVPIYAIGPGAYAVVGANEQNVIFHVMNRAGKLQQAAARAVR